MDLLHFFKPKWKHQDPDVRADAVRQMDEDKEQALLRQIVRDDPEARVRRAALKKVTDLATLTAVSTSDGDEELRRAAAEKLGERIIATAIASGEESACLAALGRLSDEREVGEVAKRAMLEPVRSAALARVQMPRILADVARRANDPVVRRLALERVQDEGLVLEVALTDPVREVALGAAARVSDAAALEEIARRAKNKRARAAARERLNLLRADQTPAAPVPTASREAVAYARRAQVCRAIERAADNPDAHAAHAVLARARADWEGLSGEPLAEEVAQRFAQALERFEERDRARAEASAAAAAAPAMATATPPPGDAPAAQVEAAPPSEAELQKAEQARAADAKRKEAERSRREASDKQQRERLERACVALEALATTADIKLAEKALREGEAASRSSASLKRELRAPLQARFQAAQEALVVRLRELREAEEWKRWANVPRLEQLCEKVEALQAATDLRSAAQDLRSAQAEWKTLPAPRDKAEALWTRFKTASDQVYENCRTHFQALDEERSQNLQKKTDIAARTEALADSSSWKDASDQIKALQEEWKAIGPVPKEAADAVWKRFRGACDRFFARRKEHYHQLDGERSDSLKKKEELVHAVEELGASTDWRAAGDRIKALQEEWKKVGPVSRDKGDEVWKRFRAACDTFFDRRKAHFDQLDDERVRNLKAKEELCAEAEAAAAEEGKSADVDDMMSRWRAIGAVPRDQADPIWNRFREACNKVRDRRRTRRPSGPRPSSEAPAPAPAPQFNRLPLESIAQRLAASAASNAAAARPAASEDKTPEPVPDAKES